MSRADQKEQTRQRIVDAAARGFREGGFRGVGVDALAQRAGLTSGAFYVHFDSKAAAFCQAVEQGMHELKEGVVHCQAMHGKAWWSEFVRFYLGFKRTCDLADSCTLQSLSPEVARADAASTAVFEKGLHQVVDAILDGPRSAKAPRDVDSALAALATLIGAVTLARAVGSSAMSTQIAAAAEGALLGERAQS